MTSESFFLNNKSNNKLNAYNEPELISNNYSNNTNDMMTSLTYSYKASSTSPPISASSSLSSSSLTPIDSLSHNESLTNNNHCKSIRESEDYEDERDFTTFHVQSDDMANNYEMDDSISNLNKIKSTSQSTSTLISQMPISKNANNKSDLKNNQLVYERYRGNEQLLSTDTECVKVAVRIRPQSTRECIEMCKICTTVTPNEPQVLLGNKDDKTFTYDYVYDINADQEQIFHKSVKHLVDGLFEGYNATVLAYGQTGSGKTYTMGTSFDPNLLPEEEGIIPRAIAYLFKKIHHIAEDMRKNHIQEDFIPKFSITAQFMELYNEEVIDLFDQTNTFTILSNNANGVNGSLSSTSTTKKIEIHEDQFGTIHVQGCSVRQVNSINETLEILKHGARIRTTGETNMNLQSSRSHAIFTLHVKQTRPIKLFIDEKDSRIDTNSRLETEFETLVGKFHFVDLAGSERLKRTGATGRRAKEGICINRGLLALGNVISALGDKEKRGCHVPYRDSKLTRLLQDSLGGNSRTLMIACVSPSDRDFMETLNTLRYANRARNIKNKVTVNQDKTNQQIAQLKAEIERLKYELMQYKSHSNKITDYSTSTSIITSSSQNLTLVSTSINQIEQQNLTLLNDPQVLMVIQDLKQENALLLKENQNLRMRLKAMNETVDYVQNRNTQLEFFHLKQTKNSEHSNDLNNEEDPLKQEKPLNELEQTVFNYIKEIEILKSKVIQSELLNKQQQKYIEKLSQTNSARLFSSNQAISCYKNFSNTSYNAKMAGEESYTNSDFLSSNLKEESANHLSLELDISAAINKNLIEKAKHDLELDLTHLRDLEVKIDDLISPKSDPIKENENVFIVDEQQKFEDLIEKSQQQEQTQQSLHAEIEKNLNELTIEIDIKKRLIDELETNQKKLEQMRVHYEDKVNVLQERIKQIQTERDKLLTNMNKLNTDNKYDEQLKKIKLDYELKLKNLQIELLKYQQIKSKNAEMLKNAIDSEKQLQQLNRELTEMKKLKVKLMNQLKEESLKSKQQEQKKMKEIALLKREQLKKDNQIKSLEEEKRCRDIVLKRKQEEIKALRRSSARMSCSATEKVMSSSRTSATQKFSIFLDENQTQKEQATCFVNNNTNKKIFSISSFRNRKSNVVLQQKWEKIDKIIHEIIVKKQTIGLIEREMERFLEQREKFCRKLNRLEKKLQKSTMNGPNEENKIKESHSIDQSTLENISKNDLNELDANNDAKASTSNSATSKSIDELKEQIYAIKSNIDYIQDQISECQTNIIQLDESKNGNDYIGLEQLIESLSSYDELRFMLKKFLILALNKGVVAAQKQYLNNVLERDLEQCEKEFLVQEELLKQIINSNSVDLAKLSFNDSSNNNTNSVFLPYANEQTQGECNNGDNFEIDEIILAPRFDDTSEESEDDEEITKMVNGTNITFNENSSFQKSTSMFNSNEQNETDLKYFDSSYKARQITTNGPQELLFGSLDTTKMENNCHAQSINLNRTPRNLNESHQSNLSLQSSRICSKSYTKIPDLLKDSCLINKILPVIDSSSTYPEHRNQSLTHKNTSNTNLNSSISMSKSVIVTSSDKANFNRMTRSSISRQSSRDSVLSISPDSASRRNVIRDNNVFNRLTSETKQSPMPERGHIKSYSGTSSRYKNSPISLTHIAEGHSKAVLSVDSYDLKLFTSSKDCTAKVWDLMTGQEISSLDGHISNVHKIKYCENSQICYTLSAYYVKLWDLRQPTTKIIKTLNSSGMTNDEDPTLGLIKSNSRILQNEIPFGEKIINDIALDKANNNLLTASSNSIKIWDLRQYVPISKLSGCHNAPIMTILVENDLVITGSKDHYIKIFEINRSNNEQINLNAKYNLTPPHYDGVQALCKAGNNLFSCSRDMCIKRWSMDDYCCKQSVNNAHKDWICSLDYLPNFFFNNNNDILLSGCRGGHLKFWNMQTLEKISDFKAHLCPINSIKVNKNFVFTASDDATVRIWRRN